MSTTCVGCKYLYSIGRGYSNYTWENTEINCALDKCAKYPADIPYDWQRQTGEDNWPVTNQSRCKSYEPGPFIELDVDGDNGPADFSEDIAQISSVSLHSGREWHGRATKHFSVKLDNESTKEVPISANYVPWYQEFGLYEYIWKKEYGITSTDEIKQPLAEALASLLVLEPQAPVTAGYLTIPDVDEFKKELESLLRLCKDCSGKKFKVQDTPY